MIVPHAVPKVGGDKGISETKSKQQSPCSNCMQRPVMSWGNACSTCMHKSVRCKHWPVVSQANACAYCMGSKVSSLSRIYLYSSYFVLYQSKNKIKTSKLLSYLHSLSIDTCGSDLLKDLKIYFST
jgi:hypothetical protein